MLSTLIVALYAVLPVALLTSSSLPSAVFYALVAASLALLVQNRLHGAKEQTWRYRWLLASYSVLFLAVAGSSVYYGKWAGANSEGALRFFLGLWVLLIALPLVDRQKLRHAIWGVYAAGLTSSAILFWLTITVQTRPVPPGLILTTYSSIMLLLGAITAYSITWSLTSRPRLEAAIKIITVVAVLAGFWIAQTRTGLLGLPVFLLLGLILFVGINHWPRIVALTGGIVIALAVGLAANEGWRHRITEGLTEVAQCQGQSATITQSMCIRLQLWNTALHAGTAHPLTGLGDGGRFGQYMADVAVPAGIASQALVDDYFGEPHSDLLMMFAAFGVPGLIGLLLIYLSPCIYFGCRLFNRGLTPNKNRGQTPVMIEAAAAMGLAVCLGFALFGLPETMFRRMNTMSFYTALVALFMVLSTPEPASETEHAHLS